MPELPEVERAAALLRDVALGKQIERVETSEDTLVFSGLSHTEFAEELTGRTVKNVGRYGTNYIIFNYGGISSLVIERSTGKAFYLELDGDGRHPVLHFGMTGMLQVKGRKLMHYKEAPRKASTDWPPRFMKFILHLSDSTTSSPVEIAFLDARRLGRIRLCASPLTEPPISAMGFDPLLSMPDFADFKRGVLKRSCPIKALLLDQSFSAGVGNWVADEILYHARVHPEQRCNTFSEEQLLELHRQTAEVPRIAVKVNADDSKFPENWLFRHRWGKGKKKKDAEDVEPLLLASGEKATIKWLTVGGRTSAYVAELQKLPSKSQLPASAKDEADEAGEESDLTPLSPSDTEVVVGTSIPKGRKRKAKTVNRLAAGVSKRSKHFQEKIENTPASRTRKPRRKAS